MGSHDDAHHAAIEALAKPGDWLTGAERVDAWREARGAQTNELDHRRRAAVSVAMVEGTHPATTHLTEVEVDVVHRVATDPGRLTQTWAQQAIDQIGDERYVELVGVVATSRAIDRFSEALGDPPVPLPDPVAGQSSRVRPLAVGEVGAWVHQTVDGVRANVSRAISLVPTTDQTWRTLVDEWYSHGAEFTNMSWKRPLSRPQTELVAARTTLMSECFY